MILPPTLTVGEGKTDGPTELSFTDGEEGVFTGVAVYVGMGVVGVAVAAITVRALLTVGPP